VTYQQYNKYELGTNRISAVTLYRLAVAFDVVDIGWFFHGKAPENGPTRAASSAKMLHLFSAIEDRTDQKLLMAFALRLAAGHHPGPATDMAIRDGSLNGVLRGKRILLVDDDADALRVTETFLRKAGVHVTIAADGDAALAQLSAGERFDGLVTDYAMPGLSGLALIELAQEIIPGLPVLVITGYSRDIDLLMGLPSQVQLLVKPFTRKVFVNSIEKMVCAPDLYVSEA
jgi:CheY-like chemotaxis protein